MQDKQEPGWKLVWEGQPRLHGSGVRDSDEGAVGTAFWVSEGVRSLRECRSETRVESFRREGGSAVREGGTHVTHAGPWPLRACGLSCVWLCGPLDCSPPGSSVREIF